MKGLNQALPVGIVKGKEGLEFSFSNSREACVELEVLSFQAIISKWLSKKTQKTDDESVEEEPRWWHE